MVLVGFTGIRAIRTALPYELWHLLHLTSYLVLLLGFGHQFSNGAQLFQPGPVRTGWIAPVPAGGRRAALGPGGRAAALQPAAPAAGRRRGGGEPGHHLHLPDRRRLDRLDAARRAVLPLALPHPGLLVAVAPVLGLRRGQRPLAAAHRQGGRRAHRRPARPATGHPGLGGGPVGHLHRRAPDPRPGPADRRRQRHHADPGDAGGAAAGRRADLPGPHPGRRAAQPGAGLAGPGPARPPSGTSSAPATTPAPAS